MSRKKKQSEQPEALDLPGPLAPWRLVITVAATAVLTGQPLLGAVRTGESVDFALLRSFGVAALVWFSIGMVNRVLVAAMVQSIEAERAAQQMKVLEQQDWAITE
jgi:hypothetical protein